MNYPFTLDMEATNYNLVDMVSGDRGPCWGGNSKRPAPTAQGARREGSARRWPGHSPRRPWAPALKTLSLTPWREQGDGTVTYRRP